MAAVGTEPHLCRRDRLIRLPADRRKRRRFSIGLPEPQLLNNGVESGHPTSNEQLKTFGRTGLLRAAGGKTVWGRIGELACGLRRACTVHAVPGNTNDDLASMSSGMPNAGGPIRGNE